MILVLAEHSNDCLHESTYRCIAAAKQMGRSIHVAVIGRDCSLAATLAAGIDGVTQVHCLQHERYCRLSPETLALLLKQLSQNFTHVVVMASIVNNHALARAAALRGVTPITEVIAVKSASVYTRIIPSAHKCQTVESTDTVQFISITTNYFAPERATQPGAKIVLSAATVFFEKADAPLAITDTAALKSLMLSQAKTVLSGGKGLANKQSFELLKVVADKLGAEAGASSAAVEAGYCSSARLIGQTGAQLSANVYLAFGLSGAPQHMQGISPGCIVIAVNSDAKAPIFEAADYALVADCHVVLCDLNQRLSPPLDNTKHE